MRQVEIEQANYHHQHKVDLLIPVRAATVANVTSPAAALSSRHLLDLLDQIGLLAMPGPWP